MPTAETISDTTGESRAQVPPPLRISTWRRDAACWLVAMLDVAGGAGAPMASWVCPAGICTEEVVGGAQPAADICATTEAIVAASREVAGCTEEVAPALAPAVGGWSCLR
jgi:hypothetical protein